MYIIINRKKIVVSSIADAVEKWETYRDNTTNGVRGIGNGVTVFNGIEPIAKISYNGRIWPIEQLA